MHQTRMARGAPSRSACMARMRACKWGRGDVKWDRLFSSSAFTDKPSESTKIKSRTHARTRTRTHAHARAHARTRTHISARARTGTNLLIREDKRRGVFVEGLSEWVVRTPAEIMVLLQVRPLCPTAAPATMPL